VRLGWRFGNDDNILENDIAELPGTDNAQGYFVSLLHRPGQSDFRRSCVQGNKGQFFPFIIHFEDDPRFLNQRLEVDLDIIHDDLIETVIRPAASCKNEQQGNER